MLSPETPLLKNHESLSITNESQFKKTRSPKLKMLAPLCIKGVQFFLETLIIYQTCISFSLFLSSSSIVVIAATISSTLVPTFVSSMNNNTSYRVNLVFFSSTVTNEYQVATNSPNFIPRPLSRPMEQEREEPGDEVANPPSTLLSTSFKVPSFMREFLFCRIPAGREHCYNKSVEYTKTERKLSLLPASRLYSLQVLFFILFVILMRRKCLKTKATINPLLSPALK